MIYVISLDDSQVVKIGRGKNPKKRVMELQVGSPTPLVLQWIHEGDEELENHLHAVFTEYRIRGEWFDLTPLGDAVTAVREAVEAVAGAQMLKPPRFRGPAVVHPAASASATRPAPVAIPLKEEKAWEGLFPPVLPAAAWDKRFPPVRSATTNRVRPLRRTAEGEPVRPGCIRAWQNRCQRPAGTVCDC